MRYNREIRKRNESDKVPSKSQNTASNCMASPITFCMPSFSFFFIGSVLSSLCEIISLSLFTLAQNAHKSTAFPVAVPFIKSYTFSWLFTIPVLVFWIEFEYSKQKLPQLRFVYIFYLVTAFPSLKFDHYLPGSFGFYLLPFSLLFFNIFLIALVNTSSNITAYLLQLVAALLSIAAYIVWMIRLDSLYLFFIKIYYFNCY